MLAKRTVKPIKAPSTEAVYAASAMMRQMPAWRQALKPIMDAAARHIRSQETIPPDVSKALDEFGRYCQTLGKEIKASQMSKGQKAIAPLKATEADHKA